MELVCNMTVKFSKAMVSQTMKMMGENISVMSEEEIRKKMEIYVNEYMFNSPHCVVLNAKIK